MQRLAQVTSPRQGIFVGRCFTCDALPAFASNQRDRILALLREAGPRGVSKEDLIFRHRFTQAAARVFELERMGFVIHHASRPGERLVVFVLVSEPLELKPPSAGYEQKTGGPRAAVVQKDSTTDDLPLFTEAQR